MLLDALTIFFLVAGSLLLLLNIKRRPRNAVLRNVDNGDRPSMKGPSLEELAREVAIQRAPNIKDLDRFVVASRQPRDRRKAGGAAIGKRPR